MKIDAWYTVRLKEKADSEVERVKVHFDPETAEVVRNSNQDEVMEILYKELKKQYKTIRWFALDQDYH